MLPPYDTAGMPRTVPWNNKIEMIRNGALTNDSDTRSDLGNVPDSAASGSAAKFDDGFT